MMHSSYDVLASVWRQEASIKSKVLMRPIAAHVSFVEPTSVRDEKVAVIEAGSFIEGFHCSKWSLQLPLKSRMVNIQWPVVIVVLLKQVNLV